MDPLTAATLPARFATVPELLAVLTRPTAALIDDLATIPGDIMIVGVAGKLGPTLAQLARNAAPGRAIIGVTRFADPNLSGKLAEAGIDTIACDLLDPAAVAGLPLAPNVIVMAGRKTGTVGEPWDTWAMNAQPAISLARHFRASRIVVYSSGCVYPPMPVHENGASETIAPRPAGEYEQSVLARERLFEHYSHRYGTPGRILRLNHAVETRHGALFDIACRVFDADPVDLSEGHINVIWQGDANALALRSLRQTTSPTTPLNVSGPERVSVRWLAEQFAHRFGRVPVFTGAEPPTAMLLDTTAAIGLFDDPLVPLERMIDWVADWVARSLPSYGKSPGFAIRLGLS